MAIIKEVVKHQVQRTAGVVTTLAIIGVIVFIGWAIYAGMIKPILNPNETTDQHAEQIINPHQHPEAHFGGCANMRVIEYYKKDKK